MKILGISCYYHDSAVALIENGEVIYAAQEERFTRRKHDQSFPEKAILNCLEFTNTKLTEIQAFVFYEKPFVKFERLLETYLKNFPFGFTSFKKAMPLWIKEKLYQKKIIFENLKKIDNNFNSKNLIKFSDHHYSHAASAFFPSPFKEAIILTLDGVGEWTTSSVYIGTDNKLEKMKEMIFPDSLGLLYSAFTYFLGFKVNSGEYKLMGLAPYGKPIYADLILKEIVELYDDGSFKLNQKYFDYQVGLKMTSNKFENLFDIKVKSKDEKFSTKHMDIAASIQNVTEKIIIRILDSLISEYKIKNICLAGGVALNCVANGKIAKDLNKVESLWIQPASGDAGGALGAALAYYYSLDKERFVNSEDSMKGSLLGCAFSNDYIESELKNFGVKYTKYSDSDLYNFVSKKMSEGWAFGWFQGRMEYGPRALGNRSIIADPRSDTMQKKLNLKVKFRESFRPFAPAILEDQLANWFDSDQPNHYMLMVNKVKNEHLKVLNENKDGFDKLYQSRSSIPAITHVDNSARVQSVSKSKNEKFYNLISSFFKITGVPILINTSFNIRGEPIVCTIEDAYKCFMGTNLDGLVCGNCVLLKDKEQNYIDHSYKDQFELD